MVDRGRFISSHAKLKFSLSCIICPTVLKYSFKLSQQNPKCFDEHIDTVVIMMAGGRIFDVLLLFLFFRVITSCEKVRIF